MFTEDETHVSNASKETRADQQISLATASTFTPYGNDQSSISVEAVITATIHGIKQIIFITKTALSTKEKSLLMRSYIRTYVIIYFFVLFCFFFFSFVYYYTNTTKRGCTSEVNFIVSQGGKLTGDMFAAHVLGHLRSMFLIQAKKHNLTEKISVDESLFSTAPLLLIVGTPRTHKTSKVREIAQKKLHHSSWFISSHIPLGCCNG